MPFAWLKLQLLAFMPLHHGVSIIIDLDLAGLQQTLMMPRPPVITLLALSYQVSEIVSRAIGPSEMFFTVTRVTHHVLAADFSRFVTGAVNSSAASPLTGGVNFLPASTDGHRRGLSRLTRRSGSGAQRCGNQRRGETRHARDSYDSSGR